MEDVERLDCSVSIVQGLGLRAYYHIECMVVGIHLRAVCMLCQCSTNCGLCAQPTAEIFSCTIPSLYSSSFPFLTHPCPSCLLTIMGSPKAGGILFLLPTVLSVEVREDPGESVFAGVFLTL